MFAWYTFLGPVLVICLNLVFSLRRYHASEENKRGVYLGVSNIWSQFVNASVKFDISSIFFKSVFILGNRIRGRFFKKKYMRSFQCNWKFALESFLKMSIKRTLSSLFIACLHIDIGIRICSFLLLVCYGSHTQVTLIFIILGGCSIICYLILLSSCFLKCQILAEKI